MTNKSRHGKPVGSSWPWLGRLCFVAFLAVVTPGCSCEKQSTQAKQGFPNSDSERESTRDSYHTDARTSNDEKQSSRKQNSETANESSVGENTATSAQGRGPVPRGAIPNNEASAKPGTTNSTSRVSSAGKWLPFFSGRSNTGKETTAHSVGPEVAYARGQELQKAAKTDERAGRVDRAFEKTLKAWQLVRDHENDSDCRSLEVELQADLERLGELVNQKYPASENFLRQHKRLVVE